LATGRYIWFKVPLATVLGMYLSFPRGIDAVLAAEGGPTVSVKEFIILQKIAISNKCCLFELSILF